jgi:hypothetical protein
MSFLNTVNETVKNGQKDRKETSSTGSNGLTTFQKGENIIAIAPMGLGSHEPNWAFETHFHWVEGETFVCPKKTPYLGDSYCPICTLAWSAYDQKLEYLSKMLNARKRYLMGVIAFTQIPTDTPIVDHVEIYDAPVAVYESILSKLTKKTESVFKEESAKGLISRIITVDRVGEKIDTKYTVELTDTAQWCIIPKKYIDSPINANPYLVFKSKAELVEIAKQIADTAKNSYGLNLIYGGDNSGLFRGMKGIITMRKDPDPVPTRMDTQNNALVAADENIPF